ncbi:MAG TPA: MFS transporter [Vicinamibacterales bacterium]|nr:MFS transporter [Vicinamibacterales bacterium]
MVATALAKARRHLLPFLFLLYVVSYLDRINVGFAALQMNDALHFSSVTYSLGAGVFFLGYTLLEIPSNVVLARVGARLWIARIMITWGLVSAGMMFVRTATAFYALRFALGAAEAGFFPGIIYCLTRWFPRRERARAIAGFMTAVVVAGMVGGPVSGALLSLDGIGGLAGWQWLFVVEGLPAVVLGVLVLRVLPEQPSHARWLTSDERDALTARLAEEASELSTDAAVHTIRGAMTSGRVWLLAAVYFTIPVALYAMGFWMPQILRSASGGRDLTVGLLSAIPYAAAAIGMVVVGWNSDRTGERRWHIALAAMTGGAGFAATGFVHGVVPSIAALSLAMFGLASMLGPFWAFATSFLSGIGAAAAIALVNSVGNVGGFVGPNIIGYLQLTSRGFSGGLVAIGGILAAGGLLVLVLEQRNERTRRFV